MTPTSATTSTGLGANCAGLREMDQQRRTRAGQYASGGGQVVGYVGSTVPTEIITAAGFRAVEISPVSMEASDLTRDYTEPESHWAMRSLFDEITSGKWSFLEFVVLDRSHKTLALYLREVIRQGLAPDAPPVWIFDFITGPTNDHERYNALVLDRLRARLQSRSAQAVSVDSLNAAIRAHNGMRSALRELELLRRDRKITGTDACAFYRASTAMSPEGFCDMSAPLLAELSTAKELPGVPTVVASSEPLVTSALHQLLEDEGALVVAEDPGCGMGGHHDDIALTEDPMAAIADWYRENRGIRHAHPFDWRNRWLLEGAAPETRAVVFYVPKSDQRFGWDVPRVRGALESRGIASAVIDDDVIPPAASECPAHVLDTVREVIRTRA
jgi:hypothetical protein